jgi:hypothetical protein
VGGDSYYAILGVSSTATPDEIRAKYRNLTLRIHPDLDGPAALFRQVQEAYEVLSDPVRRAAYDRSLGRGDGVVKVASEGPKSRDYWRATADSRPRPGHSERGPRSDSKRSASTAPRRKPSRTLAIVSLTSRHPAGTVAMVGVVLLIFGAALAPIRIALVLLGIAAVAVACVAGVGGRGAKVRMAYQRSGIAAVDSMSGRQFEVLLEHHFANKGYRVARIGGRGKGGTVLLLTGANGRTIVHARIGMLRHDAVAQGVAAMARYGAVRVLVVTSSDSSAEAVTVADSSHVTLWDRSALASELTVMRAAPLQFGIKRFSSELHTGSRICLGFLMAAVLALIAAGPKALRRPLDMRDS